MKNKFLFILIFFLILIITPWSDDSKHHSETESKTTTELKPTEPAPEKQPVKKVKVPKKRSTWNKIEKFLKVEQDIANDPSLKNLPKPYYVGLRSLAFPGWGQFKNKKYFKSLVFISIEVGCVLAFMHIDKIADERFAQSEYWGELSLQAYEKAENVTGNYDEYYKLKALSEDRYEKYLQNYLGMRNILNTALVIWAVGGIDAYIDAHLQRFMQSERIGTNIEIDGNTTKLNLYFTF